MASRLNGLALSTIGVPGAEAVDEAFAARLFTLAVGTAGCRNSVIEICFVPETLSDQHEPTENDKRRPDAVLVKYI